MSVEQHVDTEDIRTGSQGISEAVGRIRAARDLLQGAIDSAEGCWGDDAYGETFQPQYHMSRDELFAGISQLLDATAGLGEGVVAAAESYEKIEEENTRGAGQ